MLNVAQIIAQELNVQESQINATVALINEGATIPFIARYRKEVTGELDDTQLRHFEERWKYLNDLEARKETILKQITEQGKLTEELQAKIEACLVKSDLEDLYLPYKPKRNTRATMAKGAGLEPLAYELFALKDAQTDLPSYIDAWMAAGKAKETADADTAFIEAGYPEKYSTTQAVLEACRFILLDFFAEDADLLRDLKDYLYSQANITAKVREGKETEGLKFKDYFDFSEPVKQVKSHRMLAMLRGRKEEVLTLSLNANPQEALISPVEEIIQRHALAKFPVDLEVDSDLNAWRQQILNFTWKVKLSSSLETEIIGTLREKAEEEAINVFANNVRSLLLASPAKSQVVVGLDPGVRTGIKTVVVDGTSKLLDHAVIYNHDKVYEQSKKQLAALIKKHNATLIVIGNGTASRETDKWAGDVIAENNWRGKVTKTVVSEAGASIYSASEVAEKEFPDLDVTLRGAVSIARRVQDPLAELVKIAPKHIGVGQYQHDVSETELDRKLNNVVEDAVNFVGADVNTASSHLLERISGVNKTVAANIVKHRDETGPFKTRKELLKVSKLGPKAFEQCAGFLRVVNGENPLDNSSVHPESYPVVEKMAAKLNVEVAELIGNPALVGRLNPLDFTDDKVGLPTVNDILANLRNPGRDPRGEFEAVVFAEGVHEPKDLVVGMRLNGQVTNVTAFGIFVDIGVHEDGLVHISNLSNTYIEDINDFIKPGEKVLVEVKAVDLERRRIDLNMNFEGQPRNVVKDKSAAKGKPQAKSRNQDKARSQDKAQVEGKQGRQDASRNKRGNDQDGNQGRDQGVDKQNRHNNSPKPNGKPTELSEQASRRKGMTLRPQSNKDAAPAKAQTAPARGQANKQAEPAAINTAFAAAFAEAFAKKK